MEISKTLHILVNKIKSFMTFKVDDGLTSSQRRYLVYILFSCKNSPIYAKNLEKEFKTSKSSISTVLKQLEKKGLIEVIKDSNDARYKTLMPTKKGYIYKNDSIKFMEKLDEILIQDIDEDELKVCNKVLTKMLDNIQEGKIDSGRI